MPNRSKAAICALTVSVCLATAAAAAAAEPAPLLRVEGPVRTLDPGTRYVTGSESVPTATDAGCRPTRGSFSLAGPTALGLLGSAFEVNRALRPLGVAEDPFGLRVCRIGPHVERDAPFSGWLYRVNHRSPATSASRRKVGSRDEVLWYFARFEEGRELNTGDELVVRAPVRARPGPVQVRVLAHSFDGRVSPAPDGTLVTGGTDAATVSGGRATVVLRSGSARLRAVRRPDIPSARVTVCVSEALGRCPRHRGQEIVGSAGADRIRGSRGPDLILARRGADRVNVRGGGADRVRCGRGRDRVILSANDRARGCEVKIRR
jgi:hypothetical protein